MENPSHQKRRVLSALSTNTIHTQQRENLESSNKDCKKLIRCLTSDDNNTNNNNNYNNNNNNNLKINISTKVENVPPTKTTNIKNSTLNQPSQNFNYEITFPAGPIGLRFVPTTLKREIGCKIQSILFEKKHFLQNPLLEKIRVGHVVTLVDGIEVTFLPLSEILQLLHQRESVSKTIGFKITANTELLSRSMFNPPPPPTPLSPNHRLVLPQKKESLQEYAIPTTPKNVTFRSPIIPLSSSPSSPTLTSPPITPQQHGGDHDDMNQSMSIASAHLSTYSLNNTTNSENNSSPSSPPPHSSKTTLNQENFTIRNYENHKLISSKKEIFHQTLVHSAVHSHPPSSSSSSLPTTATTAAINFEQKYNTLLQELSQSYGQLQDYQNRVITLEGDLLESRSNSETEKKKTIQILQKYHNLEKDFEEVTQLRGEEIADRDAWMSRAITAEKIINEQRVEYQKKFEERHEEYTRIEKDIKNEMNKMREEVMKGNEREDLMRRQYQQEMTNDHKERLEMIHLYERERIQREEEREERIRREENLKNEKNEIKKKLEVSVERCVELEEMKNKLIQDYEVKEIHWNREKSCYLEQEMEFKSKIERLKKELEDLQTVSTRAARENSEKILQLEKENQEMKLIVEKIKLKIIEKDTLIQQLEEKQVNYLQQTHDQQQVITEKEEEQQIHLETITVLEKDLHLIQKNYEDLQVEYKKISFKLDEERGLHENHQKEKDQIITRLNESRGNTETVAKEREKELRGLLLRTENEKRQIEIENSESRGAVIQLKLMNQEQHLTMRTLEDQIQQFRKHLEDSHQTIRLQQRNIQERKEIIQTLRRKLNEGMKKLKEELRGIKDVFVFVQNSPEGSYAVLCRQVMSQILKRIESGTLNNKETHFNKQQPLLTNEEEERGEERGEEGQERHMSSSNSTIITSRDSFLTEWWSQYGQDLTMTGDKNNYSQLITTTHSYTTTPTKSNTSQIQSPLTQFVEKTYQEVQSLQRHHHHHHQSVDLHHFSHQDMESLESLLTDLQSKDTPHLTTSLPTPTPTQLHTQLQHQYVENISHLKQEIIHLSTEINNQKTMNKRCEEELIQILKENNDYKRGEEERESLVEKLTRECDHLRGINESLQDNQQKLTLQMDEIRHFYERETEKIQQIVERKWREISEKEEEIQKYEKNVQDQQTNQQKKIVSERKNDEKEEEDDDVISTQPFIEKIQKLKQINVELQAKYLQDLAGLRRDYESQLNEMREKMKDSQQQLMDFDHFKRRYESLESELTDTIKALNRKELQYSIVFHQNQEMLQEKEELNRVMAQCSQLQLERQSEESGRQLMGSGDGSSTAILQGTAIPTATTTTTAAGAGVSLLSWSRDEINFSSHTTTPSASSPLETICPQCREQSQQSMTHEHEKESILMLTQQLDLIMKETERREEEWNQRHYELENIIRDWRIKANTAMSQVISLEEQTLHVLKEKQIMEHELSQNWEIIHQQRYEIYDLQQIVENLAMEARRSTHEIQRPIFPLPISDTPLTGSRFSHERQSYSQESVSFDQDQESNRRQGSSELSFSTWSEIIPKVNQRRYEEEQCNLQMEQALCIELMQLQGGERGIGIGRGEGEGNQFPCPHRHSHQKQQRQSQQQQLQSQSQSQANSTIDFPLKGFQFLLKLLLRLWRKSKQKNLKQIVVKSQSHTHPHTPTSTSASVSVSVSTLDTKTLISEFSNNFQSSQWYATLSPPLQPPQPPQLPPQPQPQPDCFRSIFDLLQSTSTSPATTPFTNPQPTSTSSDTVVGVNNCEQSCSLVMRSRSRSNSSIYQNFLLENQYPTSSRSSFRSEDHSNGSNPSPLLGEGGEDEFFIEGDEENENQENENEENENDHSLYISSASEGDLSPLRNFEKEFEY